MVKQIGAKIRLFAIALALALSVPLAFVGNTFAAEDCQYTDTGGIVGGLVTQNRSVFTDTDQVLTNTDWADAGCGAPHEFAGTAAPFVNGSILPGQQATVTVTASGETLCMGTSGQWCEARILLNGVDMDPTPDTFVWVAPTTNPSDWSSHSFSRVKVVSCPLTVPGPLGLPLLNLTPCPIGQIQLQTKEHGSTLSLDALDVHASATIQTLIL